MPYPKPVSQPLVRLFATCVRYNTFNFYFIDKTNEARDYNIDTYKRCCVEGLTAKEFRTEQMRINLNYPMDVAVVLDIKDIKI